MLEQLIQWLSQPNNPYVRNYSFSEIEICVETLSQIPSGRWMRAFFVKDIYSALLPQEDMMAVRIFRHMSALLLTQKSMEWISLRDGLSALVLTALLSKNTGELSRDIYLLGGDIAQYFINSYLGNYLANTLKNISNLDQLCFSDTELVRIESELQIMIENFYNFVRIKIESVDREQIKIILDEIGAPLIQQWVWKGTAEKLIAHLKMNHWKIETHVVDSKAFSVKLSKTLIQNQESLYESKEFLRKQRDKFRSSQYQIYQERSFYQLSYQTTQKQWIYKVQKWLNKHSGYSPKDIKYIVRELKNINPTYHIRMPYIISVRKTLSPIQKITFDKLFGEPLTDHREFIGLKEGLWALLIMVSLKSKPKKPNLKHGFFEVGQIWGKTLLSSSAGQAFLKSCGRQFYRALEQWEMILGMILDHGRIQTHLEWNNADILIGDTGAPALQHRCWAGLLDQLSKKLNVHLEKLKSGIQDLETLWIHTQWIKSDPEYLPISQQHLKKTTSLG